jgi:signal transduction histidine kinase
MTEYAKLVSLLDKLKNMAVERSFQECAAEAAEILHSFFSQKLKDAGGRTPQLEIREDSPYLNLENRDEALNREEDAALIETSLLFTNHHLRLLHDGITIRETFEAAQQSFHEFVHPLSHYMKSPLTAILGYSSLLDEELDTADVEEIRHYIRRIGENTRILVKMVDDLLYLSRLGRLPAEKLQIEQIVSDCTDRFETILSEKNIHLRLEPGLPPLLMSPEHGGMVFYQLLSNALRHAENNSVIRIGYRYDEFFIEDHGCGISEANLEKVFRIFFTTCGKDSHCTGAGLFTVKKILELYGGSIRLESTPGGGTTVYFRSCS